MWNKKFRNQRLRPGRGAFFAWAFRALSCVFCVSAMAQVDWPAPSSFREYISNPPPIKSFAVDVSETGISDISKKPAEFSRWEGAIQEDRFYLRCNTNSVFVRPLIFGETKEYYWQTSPSGISVAHKDPSLGGSTNNSRYIVCRRFRQMAQDIFNFGLKRLAPGSIEWSSTNEFKARLVTLEGVPTAHIATVRIEKWLGAWPSKLLYEAPAETLKIDCRYEAGRFYPAELVIHGKGWAAPAINRILAVEFGTNSEETFAPKILASTAADPQRFIVNSNGLRFEVSYDGSLKQMDVSPIPRDSELVRTWGGALLITAIVVGGILLFRRRKGDPIQRGA